MLWLILSIILLLILFLLFLKVRLCLIFEEELIVKAKVLFFNIPIVPTKQKKPKAKKFSVDKLKKEQDKLKQKEQKKQSKKEEKKNKKQNKDENAPKKALNEKIQDILELIRLVIDTVMSPFGRYLKIEILKMHIKIATNDPAKTAVTYGAVAQSASYIVEALSNITNVDVKKTNSIDVFPDFLAEKSEAKINITLGLRVWHVFSIAFKFAMGFLKHKMNKNNKNNIANKENEINDSQKQEEQNGQQTK